MKLLNGHRGAAVVKIAAVLCVACTHSPTGRRPGGEGQELFAADPNEIREIAFDDGTAQTIARRRSDPHDRFDILVQASGQPPSVRCTPATTFASAFASVASLRTGSPAAEPLPARAETTTATLRVRDAVEAEPAEWPVIAQRRPTFRLLVRTDGGLLPLDLAPQVVERIVDGCAAFK